MKLRRSLEIGGRNQILEMHLCHNYNYLFSAPQAGDHRGSTLCVLAREGAWDCHPAFRQRGELAWAHNGGQRRGHPWGSQWQFWRWRWLPVGLAPGMQRFLILLLLGPASSSCCPDPTYRSRVEPGAGRAFLTLTPEWVVCVRLHINVTAISLEIFF